MKKFYSLLLFLSFISIYSQSSIIKGSVIEEGTGKAIPGATVTVIGTKLSTSTDADGNFIVRAVAAGKYSVQFSAFTFQTKIITEVGTTDNETTNLTVSLIEEKNLLQEVIITTTKMKTESVKSLLTMQKNSIRVSDGISSETIKRTPDRTTSDVLKRISGASIQDNKFVIIRGLSDRYNISYLNGAPLPSSEPDRKAFSFDIFPANMIDNLVIYKTASPDLPGEFAGGVIDINTKSVPDKNFQTLAIGSGYNTITTGKNQVYYTGGKKDWLGIDDGSRALPASFPSTTEFKALQQTHDEASILKISSLAKTYQTDWNLYNKDFSPNTSFQYSMGNFFKLKDDQSFGFVVSASHNKTNNYYETRLNSFETPGVTSSSQLDKKYGQQILAGGIANFSYKLNANHSFNFKNLYSINSENKVIDREGSLSRESDPLQIHTTARMFTSNSIYTGQLNGEHFLPKSKLKISWVGSYSKVDRVTPNERRNTYTYTKFDDGTVSQPFAYFSINTTGGESPGSMFSSKNTENIYSGKVDISDKIKFSESFVTDFKMGFFKQSRSRSFDVRQLGYTPFYGTVGGLNYGNNTFSQAIPYLSDGLIFNSSNMGVISSSPRVSGLTLFDGTKDNDSYKATSDLDAAYVMFDNSYEKLRIVWGLRVEKFNQKLDSRLDSGVPVRINNSNIDYLPSANIIYGINSKQNLRFSFSKTLNRPEFRELAPFLFYDVSTRFNTQGTPTLQIANILNGDVRYEIFPGKGQLFSLSVFYKNFDKPIELQSQANNSNKYQNAKSGTNQGMELEYRTLVSSIFGSDNIKVLSDLTLFSNLAIIRSKVDISNLVISSTLENTPMQGQSPFVFNAGLQYLNKELGWAASANLNRIGNRIAIHGNQTAGINNPALWEKSRTFLDFQLAKSFLKNKLEFKINIQNVLAQDLIFYQNNNLDLDKVKGFKALVNTVFTGDSQNKNGYNEKEDDTFWRTKYGQTLSFSVNYSF